MKPNKDEPSGEGSVPLESVLRTEELHRRPSRPPDYQAENRALRKLTQSLADSPDTNLQTLTDTILDVLQVESAGLSLLTTHDGGKRFYWPAISGAWKPYIGSSTPREFGPCGDVLDRNSPLLFTHFERRYPYLLSATPLAEEALLIPFSVKGKAVGTIWAMLHDDRRLFDAEDLRQLENLGQFASVVYQVVHFKQDRHSRLAALNLMEDAVHSRQMMEALNAELHTSEARLKFTLDSAQVGDWDLDLIRDTSRRSLRYDRCFGYHEPIPEAEWGFSTFIRHVHPDDRADIERQFHEAISQYNDWNFECRVIWPDGSVHWIAAHGNIHRTDGKPTLMSGIVADITARKQSEGALRESQERLRSFAGQLERLVDNRTQELLQSQTQLRVLATELNLAEQRERKRLAAELHDYLAQLLVLGCLKLGQVRRAGLPSKVEETVKETEEVLNQALDYSRTLMAELSPSVLQEHGLPAGLKWLGEQMQRQGLIVRVEVGNASSLSLTNDCAVLLFQSVRELLMNALKHADCQHVYIRLQESEGQLRIEVRDEGVGFDVAAAAAAAAGSSTTAMSSKFGLFSIRERMTALGGWFDLQSAPGEGTRATLVLPVGGGIAAAPQLKVLRSVLGIQVDLKTQNLKLHQQDAKIRVVLVDDHAMVRQGLRTVLDSYTDIEVVGEAWDGEEAVAVTDRLRPAIVVMDINMPKMNGIEATTHIKARHPDIIVIGLSVNTGGANETAMKRAGAAMLLTKEAAVDELYHAIQQVRRPSFV